MTNRVKTTKNGLTDEQIALFIQKSRNEARWFRSRAYSRRRCTPQQLMQQAINAAQADVWEQAADLLEREANRRPHDE